MAGTERVPVLGGQLQLTHPVAIAQSDHMGSGKLVIVPRAPAETDTKNVFHLRWFHQSRQQTPAPRPGASPALNVSL